MSGEEKGGRGETEAERRRRTSTAHARRAPQRCVGRGQRRAPQRPSPCCSIVSASPWSRGAVRQRLAARLARVHGMPGVGCKIAHWPSSRARATCVFAFSCPLSGRSTWVCGRASCDDPRSMMTVLAASWCVRAVGLEPTPSPDASVSQRPVEPSSWNLGGAQRSESSPDGLRSPPFLLDGV